MATTETALFDNGGELGLPEFIVLGVIFGLGSALFQWLRKRRNAPRYQALAERYGGTYAPKAEARTERFAGTDWAPRHATFSVEDYLTGSYRGHSFYCFGWEYLPPDAIGDGDMDSHRVHRSVYTMELPGHYGHFSVRKHSAVRAMFGQNDVQVGHPEFDDRFTVRAQEPTAAQQALRGPLSNFLLNEPRSKDFPLWFLGDRLVCSYTSRFSPEDAEPVLAYMAQVIGKLGDAEPHTEGQNALWEDVVPVGG